jgi:hypothetical protein
MPHLTITNWFQDLFISCEGYFSTFSHLTEFSIGLKEYLELAVDVCHLPAQYQMYSTLFHNYLFFISYGTITLYDLLFQVSSDQKNKVYMAPHFHSISGWIRFALFRLQSPLLTESLLLSLPPLNKMLQSSGLAFQILNNRSCQGIWNVIRK